MGEQAGPPLESLRNTPRATIELRAGMQAGSGGNGHIEVMLLRVLP